MALTVQTEQTYCGDCKKILIEGICLTDCEKIKRAFEVKKKGMSEARMKMIEHNNHFFFYYYDACIGIREIKPNAPLILSQNVYSHTTGEKLYSLKEFLGTDAIFYHFEAFKQLFDQLNEFNRLDGGFDEVHPNYWFNEESERFYVVKGRLRSKLIDWKRVKFMDYKPKKWHSHAVETLKKLASENKLHIYLKLKTSVLDIEIAISNEISLFFAVRQKKEWLAALKQINNLK